MTITTNGNVANCNAFFEERQSDRVDNIKGKNFIRNLAW